MHRIVLKILVFNLLILCTVSAGSFFPGFKAGLNLTSMYGDDSIDDGKALLSGFGGGLFLDMKINDNIGIQPEILYSQKGVKYESTVNDTDFLTKSRFHFLEIPVLCKVTMSKARIFVPYLELGVYCEFMVESNTSEYVDNERKLKLNNTNNYYRAGFGISSGFGTTLNVQSGILILDFRFDIGLTNIKESSDMKNVSFSLTLGYEFTQPLFAGHRSGSTQKADASYLVFVGNLSGVGVEVDDGQRFQLGSSDSYEINPGKHTIRIYRNDQLIMQKEIYVGNLETKEIKVK